MRYRLAHRTTYGYSEVVSFSHNLVHLAPRAHPGQEVLATQLKVDPPPTELDRFDDYFGNHVVLFTIGRDHRELSILATSEIERVAPPQPAADSDWTGVRDALAVPTDPDTLALCEYRFASPSCPIAGDLAAFAAPHFPPGGGLLAGCRALTGAIFQQFTYDPTATNHTTPVHEVLQTRAGVCQDFAHLAISALRSLGLAARYVSGYLETQPAPGQTKLRGADASHAWFQIAVPGFGWVDFDPTNDCQPAERHLTCAYGRDFTDVTPTRGLILGGGAAEITVAVDVDHLG